MSKFAHNPPGGDDDDTADRAARVVHRALKAAPPAAVKDYRGKEYNSMDGDHEVHSWLQHPSNKTDYKGAYTEALKKEGFKIKKHVVEKGAQLNEGTVPEGRTHHIEAEKAGRKVHIKHAVEDAGRDFPEPFHEVEVSSSKLKPTPGHPTDNFRKFLEDSGHMEGLKAALKKEPREQ